jgi:hypothetical protein
MDDMSKAYGRLVTRSWADEDFKAALLADPAAALKAEGFDLPAGITVKVVENSDTVMNIVLPPKPEDISDDDLANVAGGACYSFCSYAAVNSGN